MGASVIGIDIGGSTTRAVRSDGGTVVAEATAGSANIASVGADEAARQLDAVLAGVGTAGVGAVCAGAAGADSPGSVATVLGLLAARVPAARVRVVHDARLLLAASGLRTGIVVVSGTGSVAWGRRDDGAQARAGGWGHLLGDEGGGYHTALQAVRHALGRADRGEAADPLTTALLTACGLTAPEQLIDHVHATPDRGYWARRAGVVADVAARDRAALAILDDAAAALAALATRVSRRLGIRGPVVLGGGFALHQPVLQQSLRDLLPGTPVHLLAGAPVDGAVRLAEELLTGASDDAQADDAQADGSPAADAVARR